MSHTHTHVFYLQGVVIIVLCILSSSFSFGQPPLIHLEQYDRIKVVPCTAYTKPESTVNKWDWRATRYKFNYKPGNGPAFFLEVDSPFHNSQGYSFSPNTVHFAYHPGEPNDYEVIDGWELLYRNFGTEEKPVGEPSFSLYNRYDARVRIFFYIEPNGESSYQNARISARHFTSLLSFKNVSALFENLNIPANALSQFDKSELSVSQLNEVIINGTWMYLEFTAGYDPCVCLYPSAVEVKPVLSDIAQLSFSISGTGTSTAVYPTASTPFLSGYAKTALKYSDGLLSSILSGFKIFKEIEAIPADAQGVFGLVSKLPTWFSTGVGSAKLLSFLVGGGKTSASSTLMGYNHDFRFNGTGAITTYAGYDPLLFYTPGAFFDYNVPLANRPVYDNPLGLFTLLEPPVIEWTREIKGDKYSSPTDEFHEEVFASYKFKGDLKYAVNGLAGINETPIRLMGALVFHRCGETFYGPSTDPGAFYSTPLINIECLSDYTTFGYKYEEALDINQGGGPLDFDAYTEGCIDRPELQITAILENSLHPAADEIMFTARYKPVFVEADYSYNEAPVNPYQGMTMEEIFSICDPVAPAPVTGGNLIKFCEANYNSNVAKFSQESVGNIEVPFEIAPESIFPNPFTNYFAIEIQKEWINQEATLQLQDALGKMVWKKTFYIEDSGFLQIQEGLHSLPTGHYYGKLMGNNFISSFKLIKQ